MEDFDAKASFSKRYERKSRLMSLELSSNLGIRRSSTRFTLRFWNCNYDTSIRTDIEINGIKLKYNGHYIGFLIALIFPKACDIPL